MSHSPKGSVETKSTDDNEGSSVPVLNSEKSIPPLAPSIENNANRPEAALGDAVLRFFRIRKGPPRVDLDAIATQPSVWDSEQAGEYTKLLVRSDWENIEAFEPSFRWTWREEKAVRRKVDWKIFLWVCVMFSALNIDRGNLSNALSDNFLKDLHLTQADYNLGNTLAKLGFLIAELPSQLISKRLGPDRWIPIQIVVFSIISMSQFWLTGRASFLATRFLIALFQGGFIPDTILYTSYWYTSRSMPIRLAWYWISSDIVTVIKSFLAVGLLKMRGIGGHPGWAWLFLIEGLLTLLIGIASFFLMPTAPAKTKSWHHPKGYFTDREAKIIVNSVIRDDPGKAGMHNRQPLTIKMIFSCLGDYDMYPLYAIGLLFGIPGYPVGNYLTLSLRNLGFSVVATNLLNIPTTVLSIINLFFITAISELVNNRSFISMAENAWMLPNFIALVALKDPIQPWAYFALATILLAYPYTHAIQVAWTSRNSGSVQNRTVSASVYNMMVQASAMIGANVYVASHSPRYFKANKGLIGLLCFNLVVLYPGTYFYYKWRNASRAKIWDAMSEDQRKEYLNTTTDKDNKRLDFRFAL